MLMRPVHHDWRGEKERKLLESRTQLERLAMHAYGQRECLGVVAGINAVHH